MFEEEEEAEKIALTLENLRLTQENQTLKEKITHLTEGLESYKDTLVHMELHVDYLNRKIEELGQQDKKTIRVHNHLSSANRDQSLADRDRSQSTDVIQENEQLNIDLQHTEHILRQQIMNMRIEKLSYCEKLEAAYALLNELQTEYDALVTSQQNVIYAISHDKLTSVLSTYQSTSLLTWFWDVLLCGFFGRHASYTVIALRELVRQNKDFYTQNEIMTTLQKEPHHAQHRLGFFNATAESMPKSTCGTDKTLLEINQHWQITLG